jgi:hypothetical protein
MRDVDKELALTLELCEELGAYHVRVAAVASQSSIFLLTAKN